MTFLDRGRTPVVVTAPPPGADPSSTSPMPRGISATAALTVGGADIEGRLSLTMLAALIAASIAFYWWTRTAQGGG